jgi:hypothetical protein
VECAKVIKITPVGRTLGVERHAANSAGIAVLAARATLRRLKFSTSTPHHSCTTVGDSEGRLLGFARTASTASPIPRNSACTLQESLVDS